MIRTVVAAVALSCAAFASPALAEDEFVRVQGKVSYAGLDLNRPSDVIEFDKRVAREARYICRRGVPRELQYGRLVNECRATVMANGRQQLTKLVGNGHAESQIASGE